MTIEIAAMSNLQTNRCVKLYLQETNSRLICRRKKVVDPRRQYFFHSLKKKNIQELLILSDKGIMLYGVQ